ncbi:MAG TPA: RNase adapter RapZ [Actinomycetales bacterium]|nr:RNase adapter RapZ [Actinomycetales bacterium]
MTSSTAADPVEDVPVPELLIITGMSGAGRSTTADVLEDLGWYVVDNLPPQMLAPLALLASKAAGSLPRLAVVVDVRGRSFFTDLRDALSNLRDRGIRLRILFLEASDEALVRRFESVRRPHPLQGNGRILDGIERERELVGDLRGTADVVVDTSDLNVHQLSAKVIETFSDENRSRLRVTVMSFGFKYGIPVDADHVVDVRFLPNPYWVPDLRPLNGKDERVSSYVLAQPGAVEFAERYVRALEPVMEGYGRENRSYATIALGCTGGKHRSVTLVEDIVTRLRTIGVNAHAVHRDLGRE